MAIGISWNMDIWRSLNSCDSFPGRKFRNWALTSCSPGPILSPPTIRFELNAKMVEEIDLEKCNFCNFGSSVTLTLTLDRVEVTLVHICGRGLPTHQIRKLCGRMYRWTHLSSNLLGHHRQWPKNDVQKQMIHDITIYIQRWNQQAWSPQRGGVSWWVNKGWGIACDLSLVGSLRCCLD